jgi:Domain of unknown function (DUF1835)
MTDRLGPPSHFRLNFEQQQKRAKDLLKAARAGEPAVLTRFKSPPKLAEAQRLIAEELRFDSWAALKRHIAAMTRERQTLETRSADALALDADSRTLHLRCGSDIRGPLQMAGFCGEFHEHSYPYLIGPVRDGGPGCLEERARFLVSRYDSDERPLVFNEVLEALQRDERRLRDSAAFERVVIWSELDCYDQLVLIRLLAHYATHPRPPRLELVNVGEFPGPVRFVGLGQLPPEALRLLWATRRLAGAAERNLGLEAWRALASPDPRALTAIMRTGTPVLPLLAPALHRHLRELPSARNGLSFTEEMALALLAREPCSLSRIFVELNSVVDPLPGQGDLQLRDRVLDMERARERVFTRAAGVGRDGRSRSPWTDVLTITALGRAVLRGDVDFRSLDPPLRWVGGVDVGAAHADWRWDEASRDGAPARMTAATPGAPRVD